MKITNDMAHELLAILEAIVLETMDDPPSKPFSSDSYLPSHLIEQAKSAIARTKGEEIERRYP